MPDSAILYFSTNLYLKNMNQKNASHVGIYNKFQDAMASPVAKITINAIKVNNTTRLKYMIIIIFVGNDPILVEICPPRKTGKHAILLLLLILLIFEE